MQSIYYLDRKTKEKKHERVYGQFFVSLVYGKYPCSPLFNKLLQTLIKYPPFSILYGKLQHAKFSKKKVKPFIEQYQIDMTESQKKADQFSSFNDFFIRKLKSGARKIDQNPLNACIPADGRYLFVPNIQKQKGFYVKGKKFCLKTFLNDEAIAKRYENGTMVIARLCPVDYHRFHFPFNCIPEKAKLINGFLHSVNLTSLKNNIDVFSQNKRYLTTLNTEKFGQVIYSEVGAVCVGATSQTYQPNQKVTKGQEKGFFEFGGSSLILLFEPNCIKLDDDLLNSDDYMEIHCKFGQSMGSAI